MTALLLFVRAVIAVWVFTTFGVVLLLLWSECSCRRAVRNGERRLRSLLAELDALPTAPEPVLKGRHAHVQQSDWGVLGVASLEDRTRQRRRTR